MEDFNIKTIAPWMTDIWLDGIPITHLYLPSMKNYCLSEFAFFLIDDDWDVESLTNLKHETGASFLFGLQNTSKGINKLDVIDGIIACQSDEIQQVIKLFEVTSNRRDNLLITDFNDLKKALQFIRPAHFIQATIMGKNRLNQVERAINQILNQIPKDTKVDSLILRVKTDDYLSLEEYYVISSAIEERVITEDISLWYDNEVADEPNCLCIEVVYMVD